MFLLQLTLSLTNGKDAETHRLTVM